jgi:16S rRNA (cytosine967-C5)-methyltransferase
MPRDRLTDAWLAWLGPPGSRPPPLDRFLAGRRVADHALVQALHWRCAHAVAEVAAEVGWGAVAPGGVPLFDQLRRTAHRPPRTPSTPAPTAALAAGIPPGFAGPLARREALWGAARWRAWLDHQDRRPPLWVRANREADPAPSLRAQGFTCQPVGRAWRVEGPASIRSADAWRDGWIEVQDLGSQQVGEAVDAAPGMVIWDMCAGEGGKTLQLASATRGRGAVHATDVDARRLDVTRARAKRAGLHNVRCRPWDGKVIPDFGPEARGGFHRVLVDAPCTATGTWRRNPDARLRLDPTTLDRFAEVQHDLLALGARAVRHGGRLVYATCSVLAEECEDVVAAAELPGFTLEQSRHVGCPEVDADTLFVAVWRAPAK